MVKKVLARIPLLQTTFFKFLLTSGFAAFVNLASRWWINHFASFGVAVVISFCFGVTTAYALGRLFVFDASGRSISAEFYRFLLVNLVALVFVWGISVGLAEKLFPWIGFTWHADDVAHFIGVMSPAVISYFGHRSYTFARTSAAERTTLDPRDGARIGLRSAASESVRSCQVEAENFGGLPGQDGTESIKLSAPESRIGLPGNLG